MLSNINLIKGIIQRIRQKEGGVGAVDDELTLHRVLHDLDLLVDMVDGMKASYDTLKTSFDNLLAKHNLLATQGAGIKQVYEKMLHTREDRIKELQGQLESKPDQKKKRKTK